MAINLITSIKRVYRYIYKQREYSSPLEVERAERIFYIKYLQPGMTVFDVGANIGELTLIFSRCVGSQGRIYAFEASSSTYEKLTQVCQVANRPQLILNHKAVSDRRGMVKLHVYDDEHSVWNSLADRPLHNYGIDIKSTHIEEVEAVTVDEYCRDNDIPKIDLLKIDVEGAEYQVLLGARRMLEGKKIRCCVFEFGATTFDMGNSPDEIESYLKALSYQVRNIVRKDPIFPGRSNAVSARFAIHVATPIV